MLDPHPALLPELGECWQQTLGWQPDQTQQQQFQHLYELILAGNRQLNLTRITDPQEFWEKHLWDSLSGVVPLWQFSPVTPPTPEFRVIDVGTGAGFPGFPIAIARPDWSLTLLDATHKKITFGQSVVAALGLAQVQMICDRAETLGQNPRYRQAFDLALIRAVGPASVCAEYALPFLKVGGTAILYRGEWTASEARSLETSLATLGGSLTSTSKWLTPLSQSSRHCLYLRKIGPTPAKFPRPAGVPRRQPLAVAPDAEISELDKPE